MTMTLKHARTVTGHRAGLGKPSKMPGFSTSLPASACKVGAKLAKVAGSVCASCYAMRGNYIYPDVRAGLGRRLDALDNPQWVAGMVKLVGHYTDPKDPYFRIHDSGDMQSVGHILQWVEVAQALPWVQFWAPTRERAMVNAARATMGDRWPDNLVVRLSAPMVGGSLSSDLPTSSVDGGTGHGCPAYTQGGKCDGLAAGGVDCRACWDPTVENVDYPKH